MNHLGHYLLTRLLLDTIKKTPDARIVNVASCAHRHGLGYIPKEPSEIMFENDYDDFKAYAQSKLANVLFTKYLANSVSEDPNNPILACSLHPGVVRTELGRYMHDTIWGKIRYYFTYPLFSFFTKTPWYGAQTQLHCSLMPIE